MSIESVLYLTVFNLKLLPARKALDDVVFDALGLSKEERTEVYWATAELVQERLNKAGSR